MGFLDRHLAEIAERILEHIDLEEVTKDVLSKLTITDLDMYFVVRKHDFGGIEHNFPPDMLPDPTYEFIGMTYSEQTAQLLRIDSSKASPCKIFKLDMGKLVTLMEKLDGVEEVV